MRGVVQQAPDIRAHADRIENEAGRAIHPFPVRVGAVISIVRDVEGTVQLRAAEDHVDADDLERGEMGRSSASSTAKQETATQS
jgi:hypothetical protein